MSGYVLSLCAAALVAAMAELLSPGGPGGQTTRHVRAVAGLFVLLAMLVPLRDGIRALSSLADGDISGDLSEMVPSVETVDYEDAFYTSLATYTADEVVLYIKTTLSSEFFVSPENATVSVICDPPAAETSLRICEIRIALSGTDSLRDPHPIEAYFEAALGAECFVTVGT